MYGGVAQPFLSDTPVVCFACHTQPLVKPVARSGKGGVTRGGCRILARGVLHELLMKGRGAREARENFCGAHSNLSTDFIGH